LEAKKKWNIDIKGSYMIGDRWKDIEAGIRIGCRTIFIDHNYKEMKPKDPNFTTDSLLNAVHLIEQIKNKKSKLHSTI
jgi:D-glycero-D-manno-heptose 1,7-bisphosphate phosphatase